MLWKKSSREIWNEQRIFLFFFFFFLFSPLSPSSTLSASFGVALLRGNFFLNLSFSFFFFRYRRGRRYLWTLIQSKCIDTMMIQLEYSSRKIIFIKPIIKRYIIKLVRTRNCVKVCVIILRFSTQEKNNFSARTFSHFFPSKINKDECINYYY